MANPLAILLLSLGAIVAFILFIVFIMVPIFRGIGSLITGTLSAIGWLVTHIVEFISGMASDIVRLLGSILALAVLALLVPANVIIGRWSAAGHFTDALKRELSVAGGCLYRFCLRRPLKLFWLHGLLEGIEERIPEAMIAAPSSDSPSKRTGQFDGYTIVGSLRGGGSGGKLYVARPDHAKQSKLTGRPDLVVIKSFTISEGSSLPQIVRESRALECAKQLGHVLEHGMDDHRFHYVMPYHAGDHLGILARQLHAQSDGNGLERRQLSEVMSYMKDLLATLTVYHDGGFWHKDIKPENIIVHDGRAHVVDLGLITPLKSAMTLTTHGTEYFRDPEMVRQALRGVKVHQVNGVKFDIYAAGAVLYFVLENTFPAHGGLSRFTRRSPEALRWIVKRAMAEYNKRYDSAEMMLADVEVVTSAADPFAVKLSELPSMRGDVETPDDLDVEIETESPQAAQVAAAGSPIPPPRGRHSPDEHVRSSADHAGFTSDPHEHRTATHSRIPQRRPRLRVVDWFTGKYHVDDPGSAKGHDGEAVRSNVVDLASEPMSNRSTTKQEWKKQKKRIKAEGKLEKARRKTEQKRLKQGMPAAGSASARRSAREQLSAAQSRARDVQHRVARRRHAVGVERQPSPAVAVTSLLFLTAIFLAIWFWPSDAAYRLPVIGDLLSGSQDNAAVAGAVASTAGGLPVMTVLDVEPERVSAVRNHDDYAPLLERYEQEGYHVLTDIGPDPNEWRDLVRRASEEPTGEIRDSFERVLADHDLYGFLVIRARTSDAGTIEALTGSLLESSNLQAKDRRWPHRSDEAFADPPDRPYLLINDHPARSDRRVEDRITHRLNLYEAGGWSIITDDDAEVAIRKVLPAGGLRSLEGEMPLPPRLQRILADYDFGGLLIITAPPADAPPHQRIAVIERPVE